MKLKLTSSEFMVLHSLLQNVCMGIRPKGIQEHVLHGTLFRLYKKFYNKAIETKKKYTIAMADDEACAFYMFFSKFNMSNENAFTVNLVLQINNHINQKFAT